MFLVSPYYQKNKMECSDIDIDKKDKYFDTTFSTNELFQQIQDFLNCSNTSMNNLLNVSRKFQILKRTKFYWNLNRKYSAKYYNNTEILRLNGEISFKMRLEFLLTDTRIQLSLNLSSSSYLTDVKTLGCLHTLNLSCCTKLKDVQALCDVYDLNLSDCYNIIDVSKLANVNTLNLSGCYKIIDVR